MKEDATVWVALRGKPQRPRAKLSPWASRRLR